MSSSMRTCLGLLVLFLGVLPLCAAAPATLYETMLEEAARASRPVPIHEQGFGTGLSNMWRNWRARLLRTKASDRWMRTLASSSAHSTTHSGAFVIPDEDVIVSMTKAARLQAESRLKRPLLDSGVSSPPRRAKNVLSEAESGGAEWRKPGAGRSSARFVGSWESLSTPLVGSSRTSADYWRRPPGASPPSSPMRSEEYPAQIRRETVNGSNGWQLPRFLTRLFSSSKAPSGSG
ncbi:uncharacterized protein SRS1_10766 [Sporisorium reilianum f. sp. reilianum]|uniref:Uncharacterized protein n=1 Tax=Sporisorium reilianum f. sp. reilianum TaxID=72559 RepID=A0A2N8UCZ0_9BASI|nr:uncharacterized protein SRS1_10766 [Sporisorium reilianum f. sp. reilianum]